MNFLVIAVILVSCLMHAGWNLLGRQQRDDVLPFFLRMNLITSLLVLGPALWAQVSRQVLDPHAWILCGVSGVLLALYYFFLGKGYEQTDLSTVYPVVRSLPVLLLAGIDAARGRLPSPLALGGMLLVVFGCLLAPQISWRSVRWRVYLTRASVWMGLTALCIAGYSLCDKLAAESPSAQRTPVLFAFVYGAFFFTFGTVALGLLTKVFGRGQPKPRPPGGQARWHLQTLAALCNGGSYMLILWAYQQVAQVSAVVALRQFSVVIGVALAFWIFREPGRLVRSVAVVFILAGLVFVGLGGA